MGGVTPDRSREVPIPERAKTAKWPRASTASRRWHWRSGDRPSCLSGPRRKEPRSAAERLLALETKFLLFWAGQEQDSVLSRSPAPRSDCSSALRERNLPVAALWPSPTSGALGGRRFRAEKGGGDQGWRTASSVGADGRVKPSWRTAWSVGSMERSSGPLPWLWPVVGLLARSGFREFKGWPRDNKTIRPVWPKPPFSSVDRQESQPALVVLTRPQPQAPNLLGATGTGPLAGHCPLVPMKGQTRLAHGMVGGADGRVKTKLATA